MSYNMNRMAAFIDFMELKLWNNMTCFVKTGILSLVFFISKKKQCCNWPRMKESIAIIPSIVKRKGLSYCWNGLGHIN